MAAANTLRRPSGGRFPSVFNDFRSAGAQKRSESVLGSGQPVRVLGRSRIKSNVFSVGRFECQKRTRTFTVVIIGKVEKPF